jgi:Mrp family chromosome partitioning ATPase
MLRELRDKFELIVIDSAPLVPFAEGVQLSRKVDGVVMVVRSASTKQTTAQRVLALLDDAGANVLGSVLNGRRFYIPRFIYDRL